MARSGTLHTGPSLRAQENGIRVLARELIFSWEAKVYVMVS